MTLFLKRCLLSRIAIATLFLCTAFLYSLDWVRSQDANQVPFFPEQKPAQTKPAEPKANNQSDADAKENQDGNLIRNGGFESEDSWRLELYRGADATVEFANRATIDRKDGGTAAFGIRLSQTKLLLMPNQNYRASFRVKADKPTQMRLQIVSSVRKDENLMDRKDVNVTQSWQDVSAEFRLEGTSAEESKLIFVMGKDNGVVAIEDVRLEAFDGTVAKEADREVAPGGNLISNSSFDSDEGWVFVTHEDGAGTVEFNGVARINRTEGGSESWAVKLYHPIELSSGKKYQISFRACAERQTKFNYSISRAVKPKGNVSNVFAATVGTQWVDVTAQFTMPEEESPVRLTFNLGKSDGKLNLDDIVVTEVRSAGGFDSAIQPRWVKDDIVNSLEGKLAKLDKVERKNKDQRLEFKELQQKLKIAQYIESQVASTQMSPFKQGNLKNEKYTSVDDHFIVAKIRI